LVQLQPASSEFYDGYPVATPTIKFTHAHFYSLLTIFPLSSSHSRFLVALSLKSIFTLSSSYSLSFHTPYFLMPSTEPLLLSLPKLYHTRFDLLSPIHSLSPSRTISQGHPPRTKISLTLTLAIFTHCIQCRPLILSHLIRSLSRCRPPNHFRTQSFLILLLYIPPTYSLALSQN
jgi:hypothetical protein